MLDHEILTEMGRERQQCLIETAQEHRRSASHLSTSQLRNRVMSLWTIIKPTQTRRLQSQ